MLILAVVPLIVKNFLKLRNTELSYRNYEKWGGGVSDFKWKLLGT